jgi:cytochrome c-type biogenesis protein CcmE
MLLGVLLVYLCTLDIELMKKIHIVALLCITAGIYTFITASKDVSTYATFAQAVETGQRVKIGGQLAKDKAIKYDPDNNPDETIFYMTDADDVLRRVQLNMAKPQDFEMSEQVVVTGSMEGDTFVATDILVKCPSKYKDEEIYLKEEATS